MRVRDYSGAYELASQAIALNPQNAQALNFRAIALTQLRRFDDAVKDASAALELAPGSAAALQTRSWAFAREGKYQESLKDARETLSRDPNNAFAYANQAFALAGLQDRVGVLDSLRRAAALDSRFAEKLERATQLPQDADLTLLFEDSPAASHAINVASPQVRMRRFARLTVFSLSGGLLMAIGILHIVSARWREKVKMTVRRVLSPMTVKPMPESSSKGAFWSQYSIIREIGVGGMGIVYEAKDRSLERHVAVKKMRDEIRVDVQDRKRFIAEARMVAQLHHPNIVDIYAILEDGADLFLVFELVEGRTLDTALKSDGPFDWKKTKQVIQEIAAAVTHAHARGIIHRDLKPANVMLTRDGRVKVMDFGIARQVNDLLTRHSRTITVAGTPAYMAPEQEQGIAGNEVDVYAMGVCLYEMATGQLPFAGIGAGMLMNKIKGKVSPLGERAKRFPIGFDAVCARALEPDLAKRYHTPAELIAALDALDLPTSIS
jgi:tRNA A-37 threonylcarbamoyl transferase component Bud32